MMKPAGLIVGSSPAREKLPAPPGLARFLRGSRSRGRSSGSARSSPIFVSRSRSAGRSSAAAGGAAPGEAGDPSSPKVTCIGQVRIRNKNKSKSNRPVSPSPSSKLRKTPSRKASQRAPPSLMPCRCLQEDWICSIFPARKKPKGGAGGGARRSMWRRWAWLSVRSSGGGGSRSSSYRQQKADAHRPPFPELLIITGRESDRDRDDYEDDVVEQEDESSEHEKETKVFVPSDAPEATTPPKNALLLMRCRSAPHNRASALATVRFAISPLPELNLPSTEQKKDVNAEDASEKEVEKEAEDEKKRKLSNATSNDGQETSEPAVAAEGEDDEDNEEEEEEEDEAMRSESQRPLVLTRSKSEPARSATEKLAVAPEPDAVSSYCFWNSGGSGRRQQQQQQQQMGLHHEEVGPTDTAQP